MEDTILLLEEGKWKLLQRVHESLKKMNSDYRRAIESGDTVIIRISRENCKEVYGYNGYYYKVPKFDRGNNHGELFLLVAVSINGRYFNTYVSVRIINAVGNYLISGMEVNVHFSKSLDFDYDLISGVTSLYSRKHSDQWGNNYVTLYTEMITGSYLYDTCDLDEDTLPVDLQTDLRNIVGKTESNVNVLRLYMDGEVMKASAIGVVDERFSVICDLPIWKAMLHPIIMFPVLWEEMLGNIVSYYRMKNITLCQMYLVVNPKVSGKVLLYKEPNGEYTGIFY